MSLNKIPFTKEGYRKIEKDLQSLTQKRKEAVVSLQTAREMGDLSENAAYKGARLELNSVDREINRLSFLLKQGVVIETKNQGFVDFGSLVMLDNGTKQITYKMVSGYESDPSKQKLSIDSPLGKAIMGKKIGDKITLMTPFSQTTYTVKILMSKLI